MALYIKKWAFKAVQAGIQFGYPFYLIVRLFGFAPTQVTVVRTATIVPLGLVMIAVLVLFFLSGQIKSGIRSMRTGMGKTIVLWVWGMIPYALIFALGLFIYARIPQVYGELTAELAEAYGAVIQLLRDMGWVCVWLFLCYNLSKVWEILVVTPIEVKIRRSDLKKDLDAIAEVEET